MLNLQALSLLHALDLSHSNGGPPSTKATNEIDKRDVMRKCARNTIICASRNLFSSCSCKVIMSKMKLIFLALYTLLLATQGSGKVAYESGIDERLVTPGDMFPSCVEVAKVWPPPNSVLRLGTSSAFRLGKYNVIRIVFRITFSRPVSLETIDTSAGQHLSEPQLTRLIKDRSKFKKWGFSTSQISPIFLSPSTNLTTRYYGSVTIVGSKGRAGGSRTVIAIFGFPYYSNFNMIQ